MRREKVKALGRPASALMMLCILMACFSVSVFASDGNSYTTNSGDTVVVQQVEDPNVHIYDYADLLSAGEEEDLRAYIERAEAAKNCDVVIVTEPSGYIPWDAYSGTDTSELFAEQFYMDNGFSDDGVIFLIDMNNRVLWTAGHGSFYTTEYADYFQNTVYEDTVSYAADGDYYGACRVFAEDIYKVNNIRAALMPTIFSVIIGLAAALIAVFAAVRSQAMHTPAPAQAAIRTKRYRNVRHNVVLINKHTTQRHIDSGGGSGGGGHGGGHMSSGGGFSGGGGGFSGGGGKF